MTVHTLKPSYIEFKYHSLFGAHKMILPTRQWSSAGGISGFGSFTSWDDDIRDVGDMVDDFVDVLLPKFISTVTFDNWLVWDFNVDADFFIPVAGDAFTAKVGTDDDSGYTQAVQSVMTMFDTEFNTCKIVLLDMSSRNNFNRRTAATVDADEQAYFDAFSDTANAWASRAGFRPATIRSVSLGINDELKKQYAGI
jgi:hypothetical protein